jgi:hypothetical protein
MDSALPALKSRFSALQNVLHARSLGNHAKLINSRIEAQDVSRKSMNYSSTNVQCFLSLGALISNNDIPYQDMDAMQ